MVVYSVSLQAPCSMHIIFLPWPITFQDHLTFSSNLPYFSNWFGWRICTCVEAPVYVDRRSGSIILNHLERNRSLIRNSSRFSPSFGNHAFAESISPLHVLQTRLMKQSSTEIIGRCGIINKSKRNWNKPDTLRHLFDAMLKSLEFSITFTEAFLPSVHPCRWSPSTIYNHTRSKPKFFRFTTMITFPKLRPKTYVG